MTRTRPRRVVWLYLVALLAALLCVGLFVHGVRLVRVQDVQAAIAQVLAPGSDEPTVHRFMDAHHIVYEGILKCFVARTGRFIELRSSAFGRGVSSSNSTLMSRAEWPRLESLKFTISSGNEKLREAKAYGQKPSSGPSLARLPASALERQRSHAFGMGSRYDTSPQKGLMFRAGPQWTCGTVYNKRMAKNVIHISEAEAASDFATLMARVSAGTEIIIEKDKRAIAVLHPAEPVRRTISECIALLPEDSTATIDADFPKDVEAAVARLREPLNPPAWD